MGKILLFVWIVLGSISGSAATHCACEVGQESGQKFFYKIGCNRWLAKKQCTTKTVINRKAKAPLAKFLPKINPGDQLELGFVGRWIDSQWTLLFVDEELVPLLKKNVSIVYDNTASLSMNDPDGVQAYLSELQLPQKSSILVKGNQTNSVGLWDSILWGNANFYAFASTEWVVTGFPNCETIENKKCSAAFQSGERGRCHNTEINRKIWLTCKKPKAGSGEFEWQRD